MCTLFTTIKAEAEMFNKQQSSSRTRHSTQAIESEKNEQNGKESARHRGSHNAKKKNQS